MASEVTPKQDIITKDLEEIEEYVTLSFLVKPRHPPAYSQIDHMTIDKAAHCA